MRVHGLRERRERQGRAQRYREETRASRARLGEPSRAPRRRPHRASGRSIPFAGHHPVGARVLNRVRVDDAAREDASPFGEARATARKTPVLLSSSLAGETRARVSSGARGRATRGETCAEKKSQLCASSFLPYAQPVTSRAIAFGRGRAPLRTRFLAFGAQKRLLRLHTRKTSRERFRPGASPSAHYRSFLVTSPGTRASRPVVNTRGSR